MSIYEYSETSGPCSRCNGSGHRRIDDLHSERCECLEQKRARRIYDGLFGPQSPPPVSAPKCNLLLPEQKNPYSLTFNRVVVRGTWLAFVAQAKQVWFPLAALATTSNPVRVTTDRELRAKYFREGDSVQSSLRALNQEDRLSPEQLRSFEEGAVDFDTFVLAPRLLLIRLGFQRVRTTTISSLIMETLILREQRPTPGGLWLFLDDAFPFDKALPVWSKELEDHMKARYLTIRLNPEESPLADMEAGSSLDSAAPDVGDGLDDV